MEKEEEEEVVEEEEEEEEESIESYFFFFVCNAFVAALEGHECTERKGSRWAEGRYGRATTRFEHLSFLFRGTVRDRAERSDCSK